MLQNMSPQTFLLQWFQGCEVEYRIEGTSVSGRMSWRNFKEIELLRRFTPIERIDAMLRTLIKTGYGKIVSGF